MPKVKTHFEQVPLEVVRTVIEEQIWREAKIEQEQRLREKMTVKKVVVVAKQIQGRLRQILPSGSEQGSI
jgi:hypothetical protein